MRAHYTKEELDAEIDFDFEMDYDYEMDPDYDVEVDIDREMDYDDKRVFGVEVGPGDWAKAKALLAAGKDINYQGIAGAHEFDGNGDVAGIYGKSVVKDGKWSETLID